MTILNRLASSLGVRTPTERIMQQRAARFGGWSAAAVSPYLLNQPLWPDHNLATYADAYESLVSVYACIHARANAVSTATVRVYNEVDGDLEELPDHPVRQLMRRPNAMTSEAEFLVVTQTLIDATGFCAIEKERNAAGQVIGLWHLRSDWLRPILRDQSPPDWQYEVPGRAPVVIPASELIVVRSGTALDMSPTGQSPISVALREIGIEDSAVEYLKLFFDGGGVPRHALVTPEAIRDQADADAIRERWQQTYGGFQRWTNIALLSGGLDVKQIGTNIDEMAYPELRQLTEARICSAFGVPPILIHSATGLAHATYSNYAEARRAFFEDTVQPLWSRIDGALERGLLAEFDLSPNVTLQFDLSGVIALQDNVNEAWSRAVSALQAGAITLNQAQQQIGMPGFGDAGDVLYMPSGIEVVRPDDLAVLADQAAAPPQPVPPALAAANADNGMDDGEDDGVDLSPEDAAAVDAIAATDDATLSADAVIETRADIVDLETRARIVTNNRRNASTVAARFAPRLIGMYRSQGQRLVDAVQKRGDAAMERRAIEDDLLPLLGDFDDELATLLTDLYTSAGRMAFGSAARSLNLSRPLAYDPQNPAMRATLRYLGSRIVGINETTRQDVARIVAAFTTDGTNMPQLADALRGLYEETYKNRSVTIARSESQAAYNLGTRDAYKASGVVYAMQLFDNPNHDDDPGSDGLTCAQRNGVITDVDKVEQHIVAEHPNGTLAVAPLVVKPLGTV